jgi:cobyrinic acid a,c-diamide synthase
VIIPRLVIADERRNDSIPPGILLVAALKSAGRPLRIFCADPDEYLVRLVSLAAGEPVTILDSFTCGSPRILKTLFQVSCDPGCLNVILAPLGERRDDDSFTVFTQGPSLAKLLECPILPVIYSDSSSAVIAGLLEKAVSGIAEREEVSVPGVIFSSVLNPREFQLLEIEAGRRTPLLSLGYIPKTLERKRTSLLELCLDSSAEKAALPLKSAAAQLASMEGQIDWNALWGFARLSAKWSKVEEPHRDRAKGHTMGVMAHGALDLEGDNASRLFSYLGFNVRKIYPGEAGRPSDLYGLYIPHGLGFLCAEHLLGIPSARTWFSRIFDSGVPVFVNGGISLLLGESFVLPNGKSYEGMGLFRYRGQYTMPSSDFTKVEISSFEGDDVLNLGEKLRGRRVSYTSVHNPGERSRSIWTLKDAKTGRDLGLSGWSRARGVATDLCVDIWSNMEAVYRWLVHRKA